MVKCRLKKNKNFLTNISCVRLYSASQAFHRNYDNCKKQVTPVRLAGSCKSCCVITFALSYLIANLLITVHKVHCKRLFSSLDSQVITRTDSDRILVIYQNQFFIKFNLLNS